MTESIKNTLELLARESNPAARSTLIRKVTAEYARRTGHAPSEMERNLFSALVIDLYDQVDPTVRRDLITLLAKTRNITTDLAERLSHERDEWVAALYEHSPMLSDALLLEAIRIRSEAVLISIAKRRQVPEDLVDALMARAYASVVKQLLINHGATFSRHSLMLCTIICQTSQSILSLVAARCLSDSDFNERVSDQLKDGSRFLPTSFVKAMQDGTLSELAGDWEHLDAGLELDGEAVSLEEAVLSVNLGEKSFDTLLANVIERNVKEDIIWLLKDAQGLSSKAVEHLLVSDGNRTLKRILLDQHVSVKTFEALMQWRVATMGFPSRHMFRDIEDYRQSARRAAG